MNAIAVPRRVRQSLERDETRALRRQETIRVGVKGSTLAALAQGVERTETDVDKEIVGTVHGTG